MAFFKKQDTPIYVRVAEFATVVAKSQDAGAKKISKVVAIKIAANSSKFADKELSTIETMLS